MKLLFTAALKNKKHYLLLFFAVILMWLSTIGGMMEMFSMGVISSKGVDFFELFAKEEEGKIRKPAEKVSLKDIQKKWGKIDKENKGEISQQEALSYLTANQKGNFLNDIMHEVDKKFNILSNSSNLLYLLFFVALFIAITTFGNKYLNQLVAIRVSRDMRQAYFEHIQTLPMSFYQKHNIGSLSSRVVGDAGQVADAINSALLNYVQTPFTVIASLVACFIFSFSLSMIIFVGVPLIVVPIVFIAKKVKAISKEMLRNQENFASVLIDFLSGIQTVKVFAMEGFSLKKYCEQNERMAVLQEKNARYSFSSQPIIHMLGTMFLVVIILYALYIEKMGLPEILVYCGLVHLSYQPIKKFAEENNNIQKGVAAAERMYEVLGLKPDIKDHDGAIEMKSFDSQIEFDDVWFRYHDEWILRGVSFTAKKGEFVALVGPTGAGKSTIAQLLPRLYEVEKGEIRIDGRPLSAYTQRSLRENIAFVPQKPFLFLDTVSENIAFGRSFTKEEIEKAAIGAHADEFVQALPQKYETMLSEAGKNLSGGQQQRLAIARALVKKADILIMDEPTSALDAVSENKIKEALSDLQGEGTQILIAHRLTTIEKADKIVYLEGGKKIAEGTKDELLKSCPSFKMMWEMAKYSDEETLADGEG